eukprot:TRINITY_DN4376_c0_g1_i1.p1 TRINITY_DN4376_c0_g1~~TRINITY_DN4376_c0_g1_i1.p1  ORF type:complete len:430 (-),score=98.26 TRINITY_DN4376_c0_g1_i1:20-1309(-)
MSLTKQRKAKQQPVKPLPKIDELLEFAQFLRNDRVLHVKEGIIQQKRVEYFRGSKLIDRILDVDMSKFKTVAAFMNGQDGTTAAVALASALLENGFFIRALRLKRDPDIDDYTRLKVNPSQSFELEGTFFWRLEPSRRHLYIQSILLVIFALVICLFKVWPLWMKIALYWISLTCLVALSSILVIRLVLFSVLWSIGFRGVWLFPNLFSDTMSFVETFTPLIGIVRPRKRHDKSTSASVSSSSSSSLSSSSSSAPSSSSSSSALSSSASALGSSVSSSSSSSTDNRPKESKKKLGSKSESEQMETVACFQFGWANLLLIIGVGVLVCYSIGVFQPENIPNFVASQNDLKMYSRMLAPPSSVSPEGTVYETSNAPSFNPSSSSDDSNVEPSSAASAENADADNVIRYKKQADDEDRAHETSDPVELASET